MRGHAQQLPVPRAGPSPCPERISLPCSESLALPTVLREACTYKGEAVERRPVSGNGFGSPLARYGGVGSTEK